MHFEFYNLKIQFLKTQSHCAQQMLVKLNKWNASFYTACETWKTIKLFALWKIYSFIPFHFF